MPQRNNTFLFPLIFHRGNRVVCGLLLIFCFGFPFHVFCSEPDVSEPVKWQFEATNRLGQWIWETNAADKQTVRFWKAVTVPDGAKVTNAILRITVDNGYTLFLDGREIGRGSDWRTVTEYDVRQLLSPGRHIVAVEGFNDRLEGGLIFALRVDLAGGKTLETTSDDSWFVVPSRVKKWTVQKIARLDWHHAQVIGPIGHHPWENWPFGLATVPPLRPVVVPFWQRGWVQLTLLVVCLLALLSSLWLMARLAAQSRAQKFLEVERVRIARDIHDDLGAQLTQLLLLGEVAQREQPDQSPAREQFSQICSYARELAHSMDEVVWAVNSQRDTVRHFTTYVCKYAQTFLRTTNIRCRLDVEPEIPATAFDLHVRRNLFLAVKEALNNAAKYSQASELYLRIFRREHKLFVIVEDNGRGFDMAQLTGERNGINNMMQRMNEVNGNCNISTQPGAGCLILFSVPLPRGRRNRIPSAMTEDASGRLPDIPRHGF